MMVASSLSGKVSHLLYHLHTFRIQVVNPLISASKDFVILQFRRLGSSSSMLSASSGVVIIARAMIKHPNLCSKAGFMVFDTVSTADQHITTPYFLFSVMTAVYN